MSAGFKIAGKAFVWGSRVLLGFMLWLVLAPVLLLTRRQKGRIVVIGRDHCLFTDNSKYFYLQSDGYLPATTDCTYVSDRKDVYSLLRESDRDVVFYPSCMAIWRLLRAGTVVVDSSDWALRCRGHLLAGARRVQLWHGVGFKYIGRTQMRHEATTRRWLQARFVHSLRRVGSLLRGTDTRHYDLVVTTSVFYRDNVFRDAFPSTHYLTCGYPRNAFAQHGRPSMPWHRNIELVWSTVDASLRTALPSWMCAQRKLVLVAPTFRDSGGVSFGLTEEVQRTLSVWAAEHCVEFIFKFHPFDTNVQIINRPHLHVIGADSDLYPVMPFCNYLVTDYSSIYMDYLLLDRPVIFLVPDLDEYVTQERQIQFPFDEMTPGPKVSTWDQVTRLLHDDSTHRSFTDARHALCAKAFDGNDQSQATATIVKFLVTAGWVA